MTKFIDFSANSKIQDSLKASLMARYDDRRKGIMQDEELDMVAAAGKKHPNRKHQGRLLI